MPSGASQYGGPVYDATIHPADAGAESSRADRLANDVGFHFFYGKAAAAEVYSHYREGLPNQTAVQIMGLGEQFRRVTRQVERVDDLPFPGVNLGALPSFHRAPDTAPIMQPFSHFGHHAHQIESKRATRRRFGR